MTWLHTWCGLLLSLVLYLVFITGTVGYFNHEIDAWMEPERPATRASIDAAFALQKGFDYLAAEAPGSTRWFVSMPQGRGHTSLTAFANLPEPLESGDTFLREQLDPATGSAVRTRDTGGGQALYRLHYRLHYMPFTAGIYIVGVATLFMLLALVTGIVVHKKIFADFFTLRLRKGQRSWLDAHNLSSVLALPFMLMITYSGLVFYHFEYLPGIMAVSMGGDKDARQEMFDHLRPGVERSGPSGIPAPLASLDGPITAAQQRWGPGAIRYVEIRNPGQSNAVVTIGRRTEGMARHSDTLKFDAVTGEAREAPPAPPADEVLASTLLALHEGRFAAYPLRWLYFFSGLLGAAMVATGLLLWARKRRSRLKAGQAVPRSLLFIERTNIAIIVGLPLGVVAYFYANRLLPVGMDMRAAWEMHVLFLTWAASFVHSGARATLRAWREQVALLAALLLALPVVNALTSPVHLVQTLPAGDWIRAGFDLFCIGAGVAIGAVLRWMPQPVAVPSTPEATASDSSALRLQQARL